MLTMPSNLGFLNVSILELCVELTWRDGGFFWLWIGLNSTDLMARLVGPQAIVYRGSVHRGSVHRVSIDRVWV